MRKVMLMVGLGLVSLPLAARAGNDDDTAKPLAAPTGATEHKVTMEQLPTAVKDTVKRESAGSTVQELDMTIEPDGSTRYEALFETNGKNAKIEITPDGSVVGRSGATGTNANPTR